MEEQYAVCRVSIAPLRAETRDQAEIVSQLLFGDAVTILEKTDKWWRIQNADDGYEGWVDFRQLVPVSSIAQTSRFLAPPAVNNTLIAADGSKFYLAASSYLPGYADGYCFAGTEKFKVEFEPLVIDADQPTPQIKDLALFFQNAPYLWGGRTLFGIDCSGFVQAVYKMAGITLKRDASQQAEEGDTVYFLPEVQCGDLAFFDNDEGRITHVGLLLGSNEIIHSSGKVRIDPIDDQGIYNRELQKYTHKLRIIKRFI
jgi:cell wall-associated NlpC family hydrolase